MYPRILTSILILFGLLAAFITWGSWISGLILNQNSRLRQNINVWVSLSNESIPAYFRSSEQTIDHPALSKNKRSSDNRANETAMAAKVLKPKLSPETTSSGGSDDSDCDLYHGHWYYDSAGPLYTNNTCHVIKRGQNCQGNGRPDKEYENWRWKPFHCELPRFNATKFLALMRGKTLAFVGDSLASNQMLSLLCVLSQVESPQNEANDDMQRWYFRSKSVTVVKIWSAWLVHHTLEPFSYVPEGVEKIHLSVPDETFMKFLPKFDVVIFSSGHWFGKPSVYLLENEIVGTQSAWSGVNHSKNISHSDAFGMSTETSLTAMLTHSNYSGLTIVVSYPPDHYERGAWNTGGSCTGKVRPLLPDHLVENKATDTMYEKQVAGIYKAIKKQTNRSKLKLMDITEAFGYRHDGHPGPYRSTDPNKVTKRDSDGRPPPQDCLHWCLPGAIDVWNEMMLEIIRREFKGNLSSMS